MQYYVAYQLKNIKVQLTVSTHEIMSCMFRFENIFKTEILTGQNRS